MIEHAIALFFTLCLANNIILVQLLGVNPTIAANQAAKTTWHYTVETAAVLVLASVLNFLIYVFILQPLELTDFALLCFMLVIASSVQALEIVCQRLYPEKARYLGQFLPLIMANCAILGLSLQFLAKPTSFVDMLVSTLATAAGFIIVMQAIMHLHSRIALEFVPKPFQGAAIHLVTLSLFSLAWMGFTGV